mmetsp:Transcript_1194/g.2355  ORF Transcript_1194/g.2355 Transcript_1194/m.2355 type:complete len:99 (-) Transcript_1194:800-1096(-)|eukprot:scaffold34676_cov176-Amphora_coffeaeformis.AAC.10
MMEKWVKANVEAEKLGNWSSMAEFYTEDAVDSSNMRHNREFRAKGREEIRNIALGWFMKGFERWTYPFQGVIIDDKKGSVVVFYKQVAPAKRPDGSNF